MCFSAFQNQQTEPPKESAAVDMSPELDRPRSPPRRVYGFQVIETPGGRQAGMPCDCPLRCFDKIPVSYRRELLTMFWDLESEAHRDTYLSECILYDEGFFAAPKPGQSVPVMYIIKRGNKAVRVCKRAFLSVFGLHKSGRWRVEALENEVVKVKTEDDPALQASPKQKRIGRPPTQLKSKEIAKKEKEPREVEEKEEESPMNTRRVTRSRPAPEPEPVATARERRGRPRKVQDSPKALTTKPVPKSKRDPEAPLPPEPQAPPPARRGRGRRSWRGRTRSGKGDSQENSEASEVDSQSEEQEAGQGHPAQYDGEADERTGQPKLKIPPAGVQGEPLNSLEQEMLNQMDEAIETVETNTPAPALNNQSPPKTRKPLAARIAELGAKEATLAAAHEATRHVRTLKPGDTILRAKKESKYMDMMERVEHVEQHIAIYVTGPLEDYKGKYEGEDELINWSEDDIRHWYNHYVQKYCVEQGYQAVSWELYCKLFIKATGVEGPEDSVSLEGLTPKERREERLAELMASLPPPPEVAPEYGRPEEQGEVDDYEAAYTEQEQAEFDKQVAARWGPGRKGRRSRPRGEMEGGAEPVQGEVDEGEMEEEEEEYPPDEDEVREAER